MSNKQKVSVSENKLSLFDKLALKNITNNDAKSKDDNGCPIVRPLIFTSQDPKNPINMPILNDITMEMMSDANLEICNQLNCFYDEADKYIFANLYIDQRLIICDSVANAIIESTILSFSNYWTGVSKFILKSSDDSFRYDCIDKLRSNLKSNRSELCSFVENFLIYYANIIKDNLVINKKDLKDCIQSIENYINQKGIVIAQYLSTIIASTISDFLFDRFININNSTEFEIMYNNSTVIKELYNNNYSDIEAFTITLIEYVIRPSLYTLVQSSISPSVSNILRSATASLYTMYNDAKFKFEQTYIK